MGIISSYAADIITQHFLVDTLTSMRLEDAIQSSSFITGMSILVGEEAVAETVEALVDMGYVRNVDEPPFFVVDIDRAVADNPEFPELSSIEGSERFQVVAQIGASIIKAQELYSPVEVPEQEPVSPLILP